MARLGIDCCLLMISIYVTIFTLYYLHIIGVCSTSLITFFLFNRKMNNLFEARTSIEPVVVTKWLSRSPRILVFEHLKCSEGIRNFQNSLNESSPEWPLIQPNNIPANSVFVFYNKREYKRAVIKFIREEKTVAQCVDWDNVIDITEFSVIRSIPKGSFLDRPWKKGKGYLYGLVVKDEVSESVIELYDRFFTNNQFQIVLCMTTRKRPCFLVTLI